MRTRLIFMLTILLIFCACTSFHGIKPLYPGVGNPNIPKQVDSLYPTFLWEPSPDPDVTYDFILYEGIRIEDFWRGIKRALGEEVCYCQGLKTSKFTTEKSLKPGMEYYWSVRTRKGDHVSQWSLYDYFLFLGTGFIKADNRPFCFKTP
ncbi:MAG: hypothetical protein ACFFDN_37470 [Candidatus Hodarchaeota archaeon]